MITMKELMDDIRQDIDQPERAMVNFLADIIKYMDANGVELDMAYCMKFAIDMMDDYKEDREEYLEDLKDYIL